MSSDLTLFWIIVFLADGLMVGQCIYLWRGARRKDPDLCLNFHLIELWSAALGLGASIAIVGTMLQSTDGLAEFAPLAAALFIPHQLGGVFIFTRTGHQQFPIEKRSSAGLFFRTLLSALCGLVFPIVSFFWLMLVVFGLAILIGLWPITLVVLVSAFVYRARKNRDASSPSPAIEGIPPPSSPPPPLPPMTGPQLR